MIRTMAVIGFVLAQTAPAAAATCAGADPAITSVAVKSVARNGLLDRYTLVGTVTNVGSEAQASNVLQFVDIYQYGRKLDSRSIPPLPAAESRTFSFIWPRSSDAGRGTTTLDFRLDLRAPMPPGREACNPSNGTYRLTF